MRLVEQLRAQIGCADRIGLGGHQLASRFIPAQHHPEAEGEKQTKQAQQAAEQISLLRDRLCGMCPSFDARRSRALRVR